MGTNQTDHNGPTVGRLTQAEHAEALLLQRMAARTRIAFVAAYQNQQLRLTGVPCDWGNRPMAQWDGGQTAQGRRCQAVWPKIALRCLKAGIDPGAFVLAQFATQPGQPLRPNYCLSQVALQNWHNYVGWLEVNLERKLTTQQDSFTTRVGWQRLIGGVSVAAAHYAVLISPDEDFSALYRYCKAVQLGVAPVQDLFYEDAVIEYAFLHKAYTEAWGAFIPPTLEAGAADLARQINRMVS